MRRIRIESVDEWAFLAPYLTLMREDAHERPPLREILKGLRYPLRPGGAWE